MSALHLAVSRGAEQSVAKLLSLGANSTAPLCFPVDEVDEPEWDEPSGSFTNGLAGLNALQLAALRSDSKMCSLLLAHGADASSLARLPGATAASLPAALAPQLAPIKGDDGEALECPICYEPLLRLTSEWTPCCVRPFHAYCIAQLTSCPMCRSSLGRGAADATHADGELAAALERAHQQGARRAPNSLESTTNHVEALELSFRGPWFDHSSHPEAGPSTWGSY